MEGAQAIAAHESPRTTKLYDRTADDITLDDVQRIQELRVSGLSLRAVAKAMGVSTSVVRRVCWAETRVVWWGGGRGRQ